MIPFWSLTQNRGDWLQPRCLSHRISPRSSRAVMSHCFFTVLVRITLVAHIENNHCDTVHHHDHDSETANRVLGCHCGNQLNNLGKFCVRIPSVRLSSWRWTAMSGGNVLNGFAVPLLEHQFRPVAKRWCSFAVGLTHSAQVSQAKIFSIYSAEKHITTVNWRTNDWIPPSKFLGKRT